MMLGLVGLFATVVVFLGVVAVLVPPDGAAMAAVAGSTAV
jgi:hypothetical protein